MKANNLLFINMVALLLSLSAKAQNSESVTLNVNLYPVQTIELNSAQNSVNLNYKTKEDYKNGVQITEDNHLKVYSTGGFAIKVKSISPDLTTSSGSGTSIDAADITVTATQGSINGMEYFNATAVALSTSDMELISSETGANNKTFNINYSAKGGDEYVNKFFKNQSPTVYTTQVLYSIEPI
ncbi:hypothetical protein [Chryseobacterium sp. MDT2-18]|uniref:hypothetical protein n=1 Tax=Chryseobacterium sp. MDT2-18 TaxID=1259136 RepID=UPI002785B12C|nr:hypothetical protein [Chryseobacterium sp. MDT2-18]MDQ0477954.1 hypothetical protein [Chryseobacterium sp. MDT2-18]